MDRTQTRVVLGAVAELLLAGPQYAASGTIRLRAVPGGIVTVAPPDVRLEGSEVVGPVGRHPLAGTYAELAAAVGVVPRRLDDVYGDHAEVALEDAIEVDAGRLDVLLEALSLGDAALRSFAPAADPVLWPEHLDVAVTLDEVGFGVSPGDTHLPEPYAYVGPWRPRSGSFWDQPFGAARGLGDLNGLDGIVAFFREGAERAASDPLVDG